MNDIFCCKCGEPAAFPKGKTEPWTCLQCETGDPALASASGSPTQPKLTELQQAKLIKGIGARVYLRGLEVIVVAGDMDALKAAWSRLVPDLDIIESRCQPAIVIAANDWLGNDPDQRPGD